MTAKSKLRALLGLVIATLVVGVGSASAAVTPTFYTTASPSEPVGLQIYDHANLMASATGTITFRLYAPGDVSCQSPVFSSTVAVSGTGSDNSAPYNTPVAGTYQWVASYSGDANDNPISSACGAPSQSVIVNKAFPVGSVTAAANGSGQIHGTATLQGGFAPLGGTVTFTVTGPGDQWCSGAPVYTRTVPVNGAGSYDSGWYTPTAAGTYTYRIRYNGDASNNGAGPTNCLDQNDTVTLTQGQLAPPGRTPPPPTGGGGGGGGGGGTGTPAPPGTAKPPAGSSGAAGGGTAGAPAASTPAMGPAATVFRGPTRCVRGAFTVYVVGGSVRQVSYYLRGRRLRTVARADGRGRFQATLRATGLRRGSRQRLTAHAATSGGTVVVLHRTVSVCA